MTLLEVFRKNMIVMEITRDVVLDMVPISWDKNLFESSSRRRKENKAFIMHGAVPSSKVPTI